MKPIYLKPDQSVVFVAMKIQPKDNNWYPDRYNNGEWWCFWGKKGTDVENKCHLPEFKPPYRPGEICYVREALHKGINMSSSEYCSIHYPDDTPVLFKDVEFMGMFGRAIWQWGGLRLPIIAMPQWASRRHVRIVSCEPIRVSEVTWHDAIKAGVEAKYCCSGVDCACMGLPIDNPADDFKENWHKKHPGKQWAWRVEVKEVQDALENSVW